MEDQPDTLPQYAIDLSWYQTNGISFEHQARSRLCPRCRERLRLEPNLDPLSTIVECCGNDPDFITSYTSLAEALFRLFLARGNQPAVADQLEEELRTRLGYSHGYRDISAATIQRLLEHVTSYGFGRIDQATPWSQEQLADL